MPVVPEPIEQLQRAPTVAIPSWLFCSPCGDFTLRHSLKFAGAGTAAVVIGEDVVALVVVIDGGFVVYGYSPLFLCKVFQKNELGSDLGVFGRRTYRIKWEKPRRFAGASVLPISILEDRGELFGSFERFIWVGKWFCLFSVWG